MARHSKGERSLSAEAWYEALGLEGDEVEGTWKKDAAMRLGDRCRPFAAEE